MKYRTRVSTGLITVFLVVFFITGCGSQMTDETNVPVQHPTSPTTDAIPSAEVSTVSSSSAGTPASTPQTETQTGTPDAGISDYSQEEPYIQASIRELQNSLNITAGLVKIVSVEPVEWNDASLGCAQPGSMSAQVITPGYLVVLQVEDQQYTYHTDTDNHVVLCGEDGLPVPTDFSFPADPNIDDGEPWMPAD